MMFGVLTGASVRSTELTLPRLMRTECDAQHTAGALPCRARLCLALLPQTVEAAESAYSELAWDDAAGNHDVDLLRQQIKIGP